MKKYKLLKDLPLANAGENVFVDKIYGFSSVYGIYKHSQNMNNLRILATIEEKDLDFWLEKIIEKPKSVWEFKKGDDYFCIKNGQVLRYQWTNDAVDNDIKLTGDAFVFLEEAEKELKRREAIQKIKKYCWENGIEAEYEEERNSKLFYIEIDGEFEGQINFDSFPPVYSPIGYFSYENAEKILEKFEDELKIILDV